MPWIVYETTNLINGKKYRGVHKQDGEGFDGYLGSGVAMRKAIRRHGEDNFKRLTLFTFESEKDAYAFEAYLVDSEWCKRPDTYNLHPGGLGEQCRAQKNNHAKAMASPETRLRMSAAAKERWSRPEYRARHAAALNSPECKSELSAISKARFADPEYVKKHLAAMNLPETKAKLSSSAKQRLADTSAREAMSAMQKARFADPVKAARHAAALATETARANMSAAARKRCSTPEWKANHAAAMSSPETRARMSLAARRRAEERKKRSK
jgi:hypothetical protein